MTVPRESDNQRAYLIEEKLRGFVTYLVYAPTARDARIKWHDGDRGEVLDQGADNTGIISIKRAPDFDEAR